MNEKIKQEYERAAGHEYHRPEVEPIRPVSVVATLAVGLCAALIVLVPSIAAWLYTVITAAMK